MAYLLECRDKPDSAALRQGDAAGAPRLREGNPRDPCGRALLAEDESTMIGSFFILDFPDRAAVEAFNATIPTPKPGSSAPCVSSPSLADGHGAQGQLTQRMKVLYHHPAGAQLRRRFDELATDGITVTVVEEAGGPALDAALAEAEVLWHCLYPIDAAFFEKAPKLRLIQKIGVGVNTIDRETAAARGVTVCNLPGSNAPAVAEHTLALMLATLRQIPQLDAAMRQGQGWALTPKLEDGLGELCGRRVGLVGWGATAQQLAPVLDALGATVALRPARPCGALCAAILRRSSGRERRALPAPPPDGGHGPNA